MLRIAPAAGHNATTAHGSASAHMSRLGGWRQKEGRPKAIGATQTTTNLYGGNKPRLLVEGCMQHAAPRDGCAGALPLTDRFWH